MGGSERLAKVISPRDDSSPLPKMVPPGVASGVIVAVGLATPLPVTVDVNNSGVPVPATVLGTDPVWVGASVNVLTYGTATMVLGLRNGVRPYCRAHSTAPQAVGNGGTLGVPMGIITEQEGPTFTLAGGVVVLPIDGLWLVQGAVADIGSLAIETYAYLAGAVALGQSVVGPRVAGLLPANAGQGVQLVLNNYSGAGVTATAPNSHLHVAWLGPK
jgi:hypothetical protein